MTGRDSAARSAQEAVQWAVQLRSGTMSANERHALDRWLAASADNQAAWHKLADSLSALVAPAGVDHAAFRSALLVKEPSRRRFVLTGVSALAVASGGLWFWRQGAVDALPGAAPGVWMRTAIGERRTFEASGGSSLMLNARSAVQDIVSGDVHTYALDKGALYMDAPAQPSRVTPVSVRTRDGYLQTQSGAFGVTLVKQGTRVQVDRAYADILTLSGNRARLRAGERAVFDRNTIWRDAAHGPSFTSWTQGLYVASNTPLGDVVDALEPYLPGLLTITDEAAQHRVSGVFHLDRPEQTLQQIQDTLDVHVERFSRYMTVISA
ncbi:FecR family protein [Pararobbsia silviterrae]|uniref:FecR family protein n=1 Tax=Pararobbsia silviterrae TaxID=1792498 RepID=UPI001315004D|nr:DUF4880 domain-containing protein [Pararobbsia silviterrae]